MINNKPAEHIEGPIELPPEANLIPVQYCIFWKSKVNGRKGIGTKRFTLEEAEALAKELNEEFPDIEHWAGHESATHPLREVNGHHRGELARAVTPGRFVPLTDADPCPVSGEHFGTRMGSLDSKFLDWLHGQHWLPKRYPEVADYIERNRRSISQDLEREERE